jgi:hypothetical protein
MNTNVKSKMNRKTALSLIQYLENLQGKNQMQRSNRKKSNSSIMANLRKTTEQLNTMSGSVSNRSQKGSGYDSARVMSARAKRSTGQRTGIDLMEGPKSRMKNSTSTNNSTPISGKPYNSALVHARRKRK